MYHSITFGSGVPTLLENGTIKLPDSRNTWDNWHLIPSSRPLVVPPGVSTNFVEIPGRSGPIDLSTYLTGDVTYGQRSGSWEFYVDNGHEDWETIRRKIIDYLHGQYLYAIFEDVPTWYWVGRFSMNDWKSDPDYSKVVINYAIEPYQYCVYGEGDDWLWDPFNFELDYTDGTHQEKRL